MADLKLAIKLEADGTALVGGVRMSRDELVKLGQAANDAAKALSGAGDNVASFSDAQREKLRGLLDTLHPAAARARELQESLALLDQAQKSGEISSRQHAAAVAELNKQHRAANDSTTDLSRTLGSLRGVLAPIGGLVAGAFTVAAIKDFTLQVGQAGQKLDQFAARIAAITGSSGSAAVQLDRLYQLSQRLGQGFDGAVEVFQRLGANADALGATNADITRLIETVLKLGAVSGTSPAEMQAGITQLGQALASGVLQGDELRSLLENMPSIARAIADGLGVTVGRLREMGSAGELTGEKVFKALLTASEKADRQFAALPDTMQQARARMENAWDQFLAALDRKVGVSSAITKLTNAAAGAAERATKMVNQGGVLSNAEAYEGAKSQLDVFTANPGAARRAGIDVEQLKRRTEALREMAAADELAARHERLLADIQASIEADTVRANKAVIDRDNALGELRGKLQLVIDNEGLLGEKGKMVAETDRDLEKWQKAVNEALADGKPNADAFARALQAIRIESDPVTASMKALVDQIAAFKVPEGAMRATVEFLQKVNAERQKKGETPLGMESPEAQTYLAAQKQLLTQQSQAQIDARTKVIEIEKRLAREQNDARKAEIQKELEVAQATAKGVDEKVAATQANQGYEVSIEGINAKLGLQARQILETASAQRRLADAAGAGDAAARAAAYANKLAAERLNPNGQPAAVELANRVEEAAALERIRNTAVRGAQQEAQANNEMAEAILKGADAVQAAERAEYRRKAILDLGTDALKVGTDAQKKLNEMMAAYDERLASIGRRSFSEATRSQREQLALMQTEYDMLGQSNSARELAVKHQQALNDAQRIGKDWTQEQRDAWVLMQDEIAKADQQLKRSQSAWTEIGNTLEKAFERVGDALVEAFVQGKQNAIDWGNITKGIIASVISDLVRMAAIRPLQNAMFGTNQATLWDAFSGSRSGNPNDQGFNGSGTSQALSAGNSLYNIYTGSNALGSATSSFALSSAGQALGLSAAGSGAALTGGAAGMISGSGALAPASAYAGANAAGVMGVTQSANVVGLTQAGASTVGVAGTLGAVAPYGFLGGMGGAWLGNNVFGGSKVAAGLSGAALGAGSLAAGTAMMGGYAALAAIPVYGWIAAAVLAAVTAVLGTNKPSVGPGGGGRVLIQDGQAKLGAYGTDNGYDAENAKKLGEGAASLFNGLVQVGGGKLAKGDLGQDLLISHWAKDGKFQSELDGQINKFDTVDEALIDGMRRLTEKLMREGKLAFDNPDYLTALRNSTAKTAEDFVKDLAVGQNYKDTLAQLQGSYDPRSNWIKSATDAQKELGDQVKTTLIDWRDRARNLGLATDDTLNPAILKGVKAMMGIGEAAQPIDLVVSAAEQARIKFEAFRPALVAIGQTAEQQQDLLNQFVAAEQEAQSRALRQVTRRGEWTVETAIDPNYRPTATERVADYGIDIHRQPTLQALASDLTGFFRDANDGVLTAESLRTVYRRLNTDLAAGRITTEQYNTVLQDLTQTYQTATSRATAEASARRTGLVAIEQAMDSSWRPNVDAQLSEAGLSAAAIAVLRPAFQTVADAARTGTLSAAEMRGALAGLDGQLSAGTITADQHRSAVSLLTTAWQDSTQAAQESAQAAQQSAQAVASTWQTLLSRATQELSEQWRTIASTARQAAQQWGSVADGLDRLEHSIDGDSKYSGQLPEGIRNAAKAEFERLAGIVSRYRDVVEAGTATDEQRKEALDAGGRLEEAGKQLLDAQNALSGDRTAYNLTLTQVRATWDTTRQLGLTLKSAEETRADQAEAQLSRLEQLTGVGREQRALLDQIKAAIGTGNGDLSQLVSLIRQVPGYQRYGAPADVQAAWNGLSAEAQNSIVRRIGYSGSATDAAFNDYIVANGKASDFETLVRGWVPARGTPFAASAGAQRAWDLMSDTERTAMARDLGWQGDWSDREFNTYVVATRQQGRLEALLNARAPANDNSGVTWLNDFMRRYREALSQPEETQAHIFAGMVDEKWRMLDALPASAFRAMDDLARSFTDSQIHLNIEDVARRRGIPGFALGGDHAGGWRMVGERGVEIEATGPARYLSYDQTRDLLSPKAVTVDMAPVVVAVDGVRSAVLGMGSVIADVARQVAANTQAINELRRSTELLHTQIRKLAS